MSGVSNENDFGAAKIDENLETTFLRHHRHAIGECNSCDPQIVDVGTTSGFEESIAQPRPFGSGHRIDGQGVDRARDLKGAQPAGARVRVAGSKHSNLKFGHSDRADK